MNQMMQTQIDEILRTVNHTTQTSAARNEIDVFVTMTRMLRNHSASYLYKMITYVKSPLLTRL
jgi:hypothetical protein